MLNLLIAMALTGVSGTPVVPQDYATAYKESQQSDKPLMVIVSADWCPACHTLKDTTIKEMQSDGQLDGVNVAIVDRDDQPELASKLMRGQMIPQIIVFAKTPTGNWQRSQLTGFQSHGPVRQLLRSATSALRRG